MLCGTNIINDYFPEKILDNPKYKQGKDYKYMNLENTIVQVPKPLGSNFYKYKLITPTEEYPYIGRYYSKEKRTITDVVFTHPSHFREFNKEHPPFTIGWDYCLDYSSVSTVTMGMIQNIKDKSKRKNPLYVATFLAANLDSTNSSFGIIEGNWSITNFKPDECPSHWKDSSMIFRKYLQQNKTPVKYAQCWIFAELLTGMLRFLGIRARTTKIHNCHIDIHNVGGIDLFDPEIKMKSSFDINSSDPVDLMMTSEPEPKDINITKYLRNSDEILYRTPEEELKDLEMVKEKGYIYKGPCYGKYGHVKASEEDLACLNYLTKEGKNWNFHVWTEVRVDRKWWVLDPSPLSDYTFYDSDTTLICEYDMCNGSDFGKTKDFHIGIFEESESVVSKACQYPELKGKKFFGPVSVDAIKNNIGIGNSFRYLQTAVNGPLRYWNVIFPESKETHLPNPIFYLKNVVYNVSQAVGRNSSGQIIDRTLEYRRTEKENPDDYYCLHRYNPIYLYIDSLIKSFKDLKIKYRHLAIEYTSHLSLLSPKRNGKSLTGFIVQTCMFYNNVLLTCHRYNTPVLEGIVKQNLSIGDDPRANRLTVVIYCLKTERWWSQMIRL